MAAGAVLISAISAAIIGLIIFLPKVKDFVINATSYFRCFCGMPPGRRLLRINL